MSEQEHTNPSPMAYAVREIPFCWRNMQAVCKHRNSDRDDEGQGKICEHPDNESGMEWCSIGYCPLLQNMTD